MTLEELFCFVDDFCKEYEPEFNKTLLESGIKKRNKACRLSLSEVMTLMIYFHQLRFRDFKTFYTAYVLKHLGQAFPGLVSYNRFVELMSRAMVPLFAFIHAQPKAYSGIYFVDATTISVCHIKRMHSHRVFRHIARKGKSSLGWFYGFKLHVLINDQGQLMSFKLTKGTTDDRVPVPALAHGLTGKLVGDKGYISHALFEQLFEQGLQLITKIKKNMKNKLMPLFDKLLLRKRAIIESVNDQLKNIFQIEHTRHRSLNNFVVNLLAGLAAYTLQPKKPSLGITSNLAVG